MRLLADWKIEHQGSQRSIELYWGDLSYLPSEHAVDVLVVSAFQNDYLPTPTSLIGALDRNGISLARLSHDKERDMREEFSCWMSKPLVGVKSFRRILCIESSWRGTPLEITDDIFRALIPCSIAEFPNGSVAMPLIGAGDQGYPADQVMKSILRAAVFWFRRGLNLRTLKIVTYSERTALVAQKAFIEAKKADSLQVLKPPSPPIIFGATAPGEAYEVFLSYSHKDSDAALSIVNLLKKEVPGARVFYDRQTLAPGDSWLMNIAESLDASKLVATLFTPDYWASKNCKDEFAAAYMRQGDTGQPILFPLYYRAANIPYLFRGLQFADCREADAVRLGDACRLLCQRLK
jgi:TIR domain